MKFAEADDLRERLHTAVWRIEIQTEENQTLSWADMMDRAIDDVIKGNEL